MLFRKLLRDLWRQRGQVLAVTLVTLLGTALFVGSYLAYQDLRDSYSDAQTRTHLADWTLDVASVTSSQAQQVATLPGVADAEEQLVVDLPVAVPTGGNASGSVAGASATARLVGIPLGQQPPLNQVVVLTGHYPTADREVLVERHFADYHGIGMGDSLTVTTPAGDEQLRVAGVAVSAEYLWVSRSRQDPMPSSAEFGVLFVPRSTLTAIGQDALKALPDASATDASPLLHGLSLAAQGDEGNRVLYSLEPGADAPAVLEQAKGVLGAPNVLAATPRADLPGIQLLQLDVDGFQEIALAFPFFFLLVGAFIVASLLNRQVDQERSVIGTMLALGTKPRAVLLHYASLGLVIGLVGGVLGCVAGVFLGGAIAQEYAAELYIPFVTTRVDPGVVLLGLAIGIAVPVLGGIFPARRASRLPPAEAMRASVPSGVPAVRLLSSLSRSLPLWLRLPLRDVGRHPFRALGTALGVASAVMLIVVTAGLVDSTARGISLAFDQSQRYDLRADLYLPRSDSALRSAVSGLSGVRQVETMLTFPVQVRNPRTGRTYDTVLQGLPQPSPLLDIVDSSGASLHPARGEVILSRSVASDLKLAKGDQVELKVLPNGSTATVTIGGLSDSLLGNSIVLTADDAGNAFGLKGQATTALLVVDPSQRAAIRAQLAKLDGVAQVTDLQLVRSQIDDLMGLLNVFLAVMLGFGVVLAAAILYNTATLSILERRRELATMRTLGERMSGIVRLVTVENGLIAAIGLVLGLPLALASLWAFVRLYSSDLFSMPFWISPRTIAISLAGVLVVLLIAQAPALREVAGEDLAESTKLRE